MTKLNLLQHKEVLKQNILAKVGKFKITEPELNKIVDRLNPNNQYTITVIKELDEFKNKMKINDREYYYQQGDRITYAGFIENKCERLLGISKPRKHLDILRYESDKSVDKNQLLLTPGEIYDEISATLITRTLNYIQPITMKKVYNVQYELVIYIPERGNK